MNDYNDGMSLTELFRILVRRMNWIIGVALVVLLLGFSYALTRADVYEASVKVQVEGLVNLGSDVPSFLRSPVISSDGTVTYQVQESSKKPITDLTKELEFLTNQYTIEQTLETMNLSSFPDKFKSYNADKEKFIKDVVKRIEVTPTKNTDFAKINFNSKDRGFTIEFLTTLINTFEKRLLNLVAEDKRSELNLYEKALPLVEAEYDKMHTLYHQLPNTSEAEALELAASLVVAKEQINVIKRSLDLATYQLATLTKAVHILEAPSLLESSSKGINKKLILAVALLLGLALGVLAALLIDMVQDTIDTEDFLYRLPEIQHNNNRIESLPAFKQNGSPLVSENQDIAQNYNYAAATLLFDGKPVTQRIFTVASTTKGDGNTFTVANMGIALAKTGKKVLLVDIHGEGENLSSYFSISQEKGLSDYILADEELSKLIIHTPQNVSVLPFGKAQYDEVLHHPSFGKKIESLKDDYDIVLIDSPSFERPIDVINIASHTQGTLLTIRSHKSRKSQLKKILYLFEATKIHMLGILFNGVKTPWVKKEALAASPKEFKLYLR